MQDQILEILIYIKGTLKYKWFAIAVAWVLCLIGWAIVMGLPNKYTSTATVHIDSSTMLQPLLEGIAIQQDSRRIVDIMKKLMFTTPNLEKIIQLSNLDLLVKNDLERLDLYKDMKKDIKIAGGKKDGLFEISYESKDPNMAKKVVTTVLTVFSEQTQLSTIEDMSSSQRFIEKQITEYEIRLRDAEKAREAFKRSNFGLLPEEGEGQINKLHVTHDQIDDAKLLLSESVSKRNVLTVQMREVINAGDVWKRNIATVELSPEDQKIQDLRLKKTDLMLKYTKEHPAVRAIELTLKESIRLKKEREKGNNGLDLPNAGALSNPYVQKLKTSLNEAEAEVASHSARVRFLENRIKKYKGQLDSRLTVETEMQNLNRDYETVSENYEQLIQRREQARMSEKVDTETVSIKFKVADPPNKPLSPSGPKRLLFLSAILILGFGAGFGLAYFYYFSKPTFMTTRQLRSVTEVPVLGAISMQALGDSIANKNNFSFVFITTGLIIIYFSLMVFEFLSLRGINIVGMIQSKL